MYLFYRRDTFYIMKYNFDANKKISETNIIVMLYFFIGNLSVTFEGRVFQQTIDIPVGNNCVLFLTSCSIIHMILTLYSGFVYFTFRYKNKFPSFWFLLPQMNN